MPEPKYRTWGASSLLIAVHRRLGAGIDIQTFSDTNTVEVRWRREYPGAGLSDERFTSAEGHTALEDALRQILEYEDKADRLDAEEERLAHGN